MVDRGVSHLQAGGLRQHPHWTAAVTGFAGDGPLPRSRRAAPTAQEHAARSCPERMTWRHRRWWTGNSLRPVRAAGARLLLSSTGTRPAGCRRAGRAGPAAADGRRLACVPWAVSDRSTPSPSPGRRWANPSCHRWPIPWSGRWQPPAPRPSDRSFLLVWAVCRPAARQGWRKPRLVPGRAWPRGSLAKLASQRVPLTFWHLRVGFHHLAAGEPATSAMHPSWGFPSLRSAPLGPVVQAQQPIEEVFALGRQAEARLVCRAGDDAGLAQLADALPQHAGGHPVASRLQLAEGRGGAAELPQHAQSPAAAQQVEQQHNRTAARRGADGSASGPEVSCAACLSLHRRQTTMCL